MTDPLAAAVPRAAELLGCSAKTVHKMIATGQLRAVMLAGKKVVPMVEIRRVLGDDRADTPTVGEVLRLAAELAGSQ